MSTTIQRPCERQCRTCKQSLHFQRFGHRKRKSPDSTVWEFDQDCKACQQKIRNERKNEDRARSIIESRCAQWAHRLRVEKSFLLINMNWRGLIPVLRAMMSDEGGCLSCGHPFVNERDIQLDHREPWRHDHDWARHHARNIQLLCGSCNRGKTNKSNSQWLDEMEDARLSNEIQKSAPAPREAAIPQEDLWLPGLKPNDA
jgi:HNH endonuclease